jgi:tRNA splicing ligase
MIFECIDPVNDPHIIQYEDEDVILLEEVVRSVEYKKVPYEKLCDNAKKFGLTVKELAYEFNDWPTLYNWMHTVGKAGYTLNGKVIEGFVLEDASGFMFKLKLHYYNTWKFLRGVLFSVAKHGYIDGTGKLATELHNKFYGFIRTLPPEDLKKDIITIRNMFYCNKENEE